MIWRVWSDALKAKDEELARVSKERDRYQAMVFDRLKSSAFVSAEVAGRQGPAILDHKDNGG
jgi:hypothetical protein